MQSAVSNERALLAGVLTLFLWGAVLASLVVPPWQGPDEPTHFALAYLLARPDSTVPEQEAAERDLQREVLQSMALHRWWEPYGGRTPDPLPRSFRDIPRLGVGAYDQPLYYGVAAAFLRVTQPRTVEASYWHLRILSVLLSVATLMLGWAGTRLLFGSGVAAGAAAMAALHPQFLLTTIAVNPDALLNVCGAFIWWQGARLVAGRRRGLSLVLLVVAAAAALLIKRNAIPFVAIAGILIASSTVAPKRQPITRRNVLLGALAAVAIAAAVMIAWWFFEDRLTALAVFWSTALDLRRQPNRVTVRDALEFIRVSIDYVWLIAGWLRFPAPEAWLWVARILTVTGMAGAAVVLIRPSTLRQSLPLAWLFVIIYAVVILGVTFWNLASPQGRYLFPVLAPATALLWVGLTHPVPARFRPCAAPIVLATLVVMNVTAFTTVLIPAYLPW